MTEGNLPLIRRVQLKELEILKVFQEICARHNLRYFAIGGTCIGAVRHGGFIPWDDDVDVAMPYEDYVKFKKLTETELPPYYAVFDHAKNRLSTADYYFNIYDSRTTFIFSGEEKYPELYLGVYVDVFPVHGAPSQPLKLRALRALSQIYLMINPKMRLPFSDMPSLKSRLLWLASSPLKLFLPYDYFTTKHEAIAVKYPFGCSENVMFPWTLWTGGRKKLYGRGSKIFPYRCFRETKELPFEDTVISVPSGYDEFLTMEFGDYMEFPPEEERVSHGGAFVDLDRPYTYYQNHPETVKANISA